MIAGKFYAQLVTIRFIMKDYQGALDAAEIGLDLCGQVEDDDLDVRRQVNNATREMLNVVLRSKCKLDPSLDST